MVMPGASRQGGVSQGAGTFNRLTIADADKIKREAQLLSAVSPVVVTACAGHRRRTATGARRSTASPPTIRRSATGASSHGDFFSEADVRAHAQGRRARHHRREESVSRTAIPSASRSRSATCRSPCRRAGLEGQNAAGIGPGRRRADAVHHGADAAERPRRSSGRSSPARRRREDMPAAQEEIRSIMRESHKLGEADDDDFTIRNQNELAAAATSTTKVMTLLLAAIASISLLVGGIGIMNIMLVSVTERTREIGIRMAIGARGSDVLTQFLVESVVMSMLGGLDRPGARARRRRAGRPVHRLEHRDAARSHRARRRLLRRGRRVLRLLPGAEGGRAQSDPGAAIRIDSRSLHPRSCRSWHGRCRAAAARHAHHHLRGGHAHRARSSNIDAAPGAERRGASQGGRERGAACSSCRTCASAPRARRTSAAISIETEGRIVDQTSHSVSLGVNSGVTLFDGFANTAHAAQGAQLERPGERAGSRVERARRWCSPWRPNFLALIQQQEQLRVQRESLAAESALLEQSADLRECRRTHRRGSVSAAGECGERAVGGGRGRARGGACARRPDGHVAARSGGRL